jgi:hypothetical protein
MGWGDFGSNGSVHWRITYDDSKDDADHVHYDARKRHPGQPSDAAGVARDDRPAIGAGKAEPGSFRVIARFESPSAATSALGRAKVVGSTLVLEVPCFPYRPEPPDPKRRDDWEVTVDW